MSAIANLLIEQARIAAQARAESGALWGNALSSVAQVPRQVMAADEQRRERATAQALATSRDVRETAAATDEHQVRVATLESMRQKQAADWAEKLRVANADVPTVQTEIDAQVGKLWTPEEAAALKQTASTPEGAAQVITRLAPVREPKPAEPYTLKSDEVRFGPDNQPLAYGADKAAKPPTAEEDKARYLGIQVKAAQKQPLTPEETAWANAYEKEKSLVTDKSIAAATDRQTATIGAQTAQQKRSQDFAALQAARADLEKNVNTPYVTAKTSASTLRDVVDAAKAGNTVAASLQSLEGTMAAIRAQGLNRINSAEIGATANAGSLFNNIQGWLGKKTEGQPVPPQVQEDMLKFADILEKAAYKKYQAGHKATNALYGTSIPELIAPPESMSAPAPAAGAVPSYADYLKSKKK